jgi:hypothetical protein
VAASPHLPFKAQLLAKSATFVAQWPLHGMDSLSLWALTSEAGACDSAACVGRRNADKPSVPWIGEPVCFARLVFIWGKQPACAGKVVTRSRPAEQRRVEKKV